MRAALIDKDSPVPVFIQIEQDIRRQIVSGSLRDGERLSRETVLAEAYGASRVSVRRALTELAEARLVKRVHGLGTVVTAPTSPMPCNLDAMTSFTGQLRAAGFDPEVVVDRIVIVPSLPEIFDRREANVDDSYLYLRRLVKVDGRPVGLNSSWLPRKLFPRLQRMKLIGGSLWTTLEQKFGVHPHRADNRVETIRASTDEARLLFCEEGAPLLKLNSIVFDVDSRQVEYSSVLWTENVSLRFSS